MLHCKRVPYFQVLASRSRLSPLHSYTAHSKLRCFQVLAGRRPAIRVCLKSAHGLFLLVLDMFVIAHL
jgi:hypothetical protein